MECFAHALQSRYYAIFMEPLRQVGFRDLRRVDDQILSALIIGIATS